jgi:hypothetical protein
MRPHDQPNRLAPLDGTRQPQPGRKRQPLEGHWWSLCKINGNDPKPTSLEDEPRGLDGSPDDSQGVIRHDLLSSDPQQTRELDPSRCTRDRIKAVERIDKRNDLSATSCRRKRGAQHTGPT